MLGHDLTQRPPRGAPVASALVGHETFCYDDLTVTENLRFATRAAGHTRDEADAALERVGLDDIAGVAHGRLSQGQRRRLSLAIALARDPELLLLDEPHAGLDDEGRAVVDEVLAAAPAEGRTVLLASHELERRPPPRDARSRGRSRVSVHESRAAAAPAPVAPMVEVGP